MEGRFTDGLVGLRWSRTIEARNTVPPALDLLLDAAQQGAHETHIGISVVDVKGVVTTLTATDPVAFLLDQIQHDTAGGPGLAAIRDRQTVIVDDTAREGRWPGFAARAADVGVRSILAVPLVLGDQVLGAMTMSSKVLHELGGRNLEDATRFAKQAAIVVAQAQREKDLLLALQVSSTIGKAVGLVMERFCIDDEQAMAYLTRLSQSCGFEVLEIAAHLVDQSNELWRLPDVDRVGSGLPLGLALVRSPETPDRRS